jgi:hypothetical protein
MPSYRWTFSGYADLPLPRYCMKLRYERVVSNEYDPTVPLLTLRNQFGTLNQLAIPEDLIMR